MKKDNSAKQNKNENEDSAKQNEEQVENEDSAMQKNLENQLKRTLADYQNLEKRIAIEKQDWIKLANKDLLLKLLPGLDNLILAEKHTEDEGVKISVKHFLDIFEGIGVKKIETMGEDFNPELMEAVGISNGEDNKVLEEVRSGYMLFDSILRPAQVIVGKNAGEKEAYDEDLEDELIARELDEENNS